MKQIKDIFSLVLNQIPDLLTFVLDKNGNFLVLSGEFKKIVKKTWGTTIEEGSNLFEAITYKEDSELLQRDFARALQGEIFETTQQYGAVDLARKYYMSKWSPLMKDKQIIGTICAVSHVLIDSKTNVDSIDSTGMFQLFFDLSSDGLICTQLNKPVRCDEVLSDDQKVIEMLNNEIVVYANQTMLHQLKSRECNIVGKSLMEIFDYPIENLLREYKRLLKNQRITIKSQEVMSNGEVVWIEGNYVTMCNDKNEILGHFGSRRDVTDRVAIEQASDQSQYLLNYIIENDRTAVAVHDKELRYVYVSQKYIDEFDLRDKKLIGEKAYDLFPDTPKKWKETYNRALEGEVVQKSEDLIVGNNQKQWWIRWECRPWYDINGAIGGIIVYVENINEEKRISGILKENELRLNALFSQAAIGISYGPINHVFKQVNQKLCEITGYSSDELSVLSFSNICHPMDLKDYVQLRTKLLKNEIEDFMLESRFFKKNKEIIWANVTYSLIESDEVVDKYILMVFEDITKRKEIEEKMIFLNYHDQLTGVYNRRFYEEEMRRLDTSRNLPMSLIVADANGLKLINDAFGHIQGDKMIQTIANVFVEECRSDDIIARIGGDEFVVLLANTDFEAAQGIAKRVHRSLKSKSIHQAPITISLGIATKKEKSKDILDVFNQAEAMMYREKLEHRSGMMSSTIQVILDTFFRENEYEKKHAHRVSEMCHEVGKHMRFDEHDLEKLRIAGLMHDIGKVNIPSSILNKVTKLNKHDWEEIMRHSEIGYRILSAVSEFAEVSEFVLAHHERWDGTGYPKGLKKERIPVASRIISVVDAYDTMVSNNTYTGSHPQDEALAELNRMKGLQFDPHVVEVFIDNKVYNHFSTNN